MIMYSYKALKMEIRYLGLSSIGNLSQALFIRDRAGTFTVVRCIATSNSIYFSYNLATKVTAREHELARSCSVMLAFC